MPRRITRRLTLLAIALAALAAPVQAAAATAGKPYRWKSASYAFNAKSASRLLPAGSAPFFSLTAGSYGTLVAELEPTVAIPAGVQAGWSIKLPRGVVATRVTLSGTTAFNAGAPDVRMQVATTQSGPLSLSGPWSVGPVRGRFTTIDWRAVVVAPFAARTDIGGVLYIASGIDATLLDTDAPAFKVGPIANFPGQRAVFVTATDRTSGVARVVVGGIVCVNVTRAHWRQDLVAGQTSQKAAQNCAIPRTGTSVRVAVTDVAGNTTARVVKLRTG